MRKLKSTVGKFSTLIVILSFSLVGCIGLYDFNPPAPTHNYNYAGSWQGSLNEQATNPRSASVSILILPHNYRETVDSDDFYSNNLYYSLKGTWSADFSPTLSSLGIFQGNADAYSTDFSAQLTFGDDTNCFVTVTATRIANKITGIYQPESYGNDRCTFTDLKVGTFELVKQ